MRNDLGIKRELQFEDNGKLVQYDACSSGSLEEGKRFYENFEYIGSSHIIYVDGTKNEFKELHHFFKAK